MKRARFLLVAFLIVIAIILCIQANMSFAKIPEPDNIIFGTVRINEFLLTSDYAFGIDTSNITVTLNINSNPSPIASYTMGTIPGAGDFFILDVPIDALDPQEPGTARPGDEATIYINGEEVKTIYISERGDIQRIDLAGDFIDTDGDGLADIIEQSLGTDPSDPDSDEDSVPDGIEITAGTDPLDGKDIPAIYVDANNTSGIEDGTKDYPYNMINEGINAALEYYTVFVASGTYMEAVTVDKNIRLIGAIPTTTIINATGAADALFYDYPAEEMSCVEGFTLKNAVNGINCANGASPSIRNNIITQISGVGILCGAQSTAHIINNSISNNSGSTAIQTSSSDIKIINNIISGNNTGIDCSSGAAPVIEYNDVWGNNGGNYIGCDSGFHDMSEDPLFVNNIGGDFHLRKGSPCIDAGDPMEVLVNDYAGGSMLTVDEVTNIAIGDRIWVTDGINLETDIVEAVTSTTIKIKGQLMNNYLVSEGAYIFTETSDAYKEPVPSNSRIDMGAYGNTIEALSPPDLCEGDFDNDGDVDGTDLAAFAADFGRTDCQIGTPCKGDFDNDGDVDGSDLAEFAGDFGRTDCI